MCTLLSMRAVDLDAGPIEQLLQPLVIVLLAGMTT